VRRYLALGELWNRHVADAEGMSVIFVEEKEWANVGV